MGPVRLRWYFGKVFKRRVVIVTLLSLFCMALVTNVYFISNMTLELTTSSKVKETLEEQWQRKGLIFSKEHVQRALAAANRNASDWAEQEIQAELKVLKPKFYKSDLDNVKILEERIKANLIPKGQKHASKNEINYAWSMAKNWNVEERNMSIISSIVSVLCSTQIEHAETSRSGTQLKLLLSLEGGQQALFKPQWYSRDEVIEGPVYAGRDRHNAEVVAFYLSIILNMKKVPYVVGRRVNLRREIMPVADQGLLETFVQNTTHTCFYGSCPFCNPSYTVCGGRHSHGDAKSEGDVLEGALILMLPSYLQIKKYRHPWQRTYNNFSARWEVQVNYCDSVKQTKLYSPSGSRLPDLVDASIFDFLMDNGDRHHYEIIQGASTDIVLLLDNGKGFGNPYRDHIDILAPLYQCCILREKTYKTLLLLKGNNLSKLMRQAQENSHISPLLSESHFTALDRRLRLVFATIQVCFRDYGEQNVLIN